ncbi:MAG: hypothetical protein HY871_07975 [Chloroflexi bacterium]|nr:hypothetical protein [Chloroflexota bacterium]
MRGLFLGLKRTDYEDVLRAVGQYIDEHRLVNVRLIETADGLILQGVASDKLNALDVKPETYLLTTEDLRALLRDAYEQRGQKA